mmetsp:Transcript_118133/g.338885  ORF Transcript_118133/g.338885 Transcript_118133/m.338885 type:complete len:206 (+) Transcript_118133:176-793(+)
MTASTWPNRPCSRAPRARGRCGAATCRGGSRRRHSSQSRRWAAPPTAFAPRARDNPGRSGCSTSRASSRTRLPPRPRCNRTLATPKAGEAAWEGPPARRRARSPGHGGGSTTPFWRRTSRSPNAVSRCCNRCPRAAAASPRRWRTAAWPDQPPLGSTCRTPGSTSPSEAAATDQRRPGRTRNSSAARAMPRPQCPSSSTARPSAR